MLKGEYSYRDGRFSSSVFVFLISGIDTQIPFYVQVRIIGGQAMEIRWAHSSEARRFIDVRSLSRAFVRTACY